MNISVLYLGRIECKRDALIACDDQGAMIKSPISAILIQHPTLGNVLFDAGNSPFYHTEYSAETLATYPIPEFISIEQALAEKSLAPADIDLVIMSHLHFDHAGGLRYFRGTKAAQGVLVSEPELKNAFFQVATGHAGAYVKDAFDVPGITYRTYRDTLELAPDFKLFSQASHTPGVTGLVLETASKGTVICTSDTVYTREGFEREVPPGGHINKTTDEFFDNLALLKRMQQEKNATMLFGHDYEQIKAWAAEAPIA